VDPRTNPADDVCVAPIDAPTTDPDREDPTMQYSRPAMEYTPEYLAPESLASKLADALQGSTYPPEVIAEVCDPAGWSVARLRAILEDAPRALTRDALSAFLRTFACTEANRLELMGDQS